MTGKISFVFLLFASICSFAQSDYRILSSSFDHIIVEYRPVYTDTSIVTVEGKSYRSVEILSPFYENPMDFGSPKIPSRQFSVGVPSEYGSTIEVLSVISKQIPGIPLPIAKPLRDTSVYAYLYEEGEAYFSSDEKLNSIVSFGEFGILRGVPVQSILVHPVTYRPEIRQLSLVTSVTFKISFPPAQMNAKNAYDDFVSGSLLNYDYARYWVNAVQPNKAAKMNAAQSVLASGTWYRFEAPVEGIYKITRSQLASYGIDPAAVDPRTIKIYNNGGRAVPETVTSTRPEDLQEVSIIIQGEDDGSFDENDYILFYGRGVHFWEYDPSVGSYIRNTNPYAEENYFWITSGGSTGKRMAAKVSITDPLGTPVTSTFNFADWEVDRINVGKSGRVFLGDEYSSSTKTRVYENLLDARIPNSEILYYYNFVNTSKENVPLVIAEGTNLLVSKSIAGYGNDDYSYGRLDLGQLTFSGELPGNLSKLTFTFSAGSSAYGYIDFFEIQYQRELKAYQDSLLLFSPKTGGNFEFRCTGFSGNQVRVFDVTDNASVSFITNPVLNANGNYTFGTTETNGIVSRYLAVTDSKFKTPINPLRIENQNLRGAITGADFIIITPQIFDEQAQRLKQFKENQRSVKISTVVVDIEQIFNEFSCGVKDVSAIRDFIKFAYTYWQVKPKYVLLFGDGTYDFKNIEGYSNNYILPWETKNYLDEIYSYCSDDFYAWLDGNDTRVDLALGRATVNSPQEASNFVDKIIAYETNTDKGLWRNSITLLADDALTSTGRDGAPNTEQSETLSNAIPESFDQHKIYLATYPTVMTSLGRRKPEVNKAIIDAMNDGTVLFNFIGHGSPELWTHEQVFVQSVTIPQIVNDRYFFLTAATCDFGYYDRTNLQSSAEEMLTKKNSGAIGVFTAVRPVLSNLNALLNQQFYDDMLKSPRGAINLPIPVGQAYFQTKSLFFQPNDQKYHLYGDPTIRLLLPQYSANIDSINGAAPTVDIQVKALQNVEVKGTIRKPDNTLWDTFTGEGLLTIYDSKYTIPLPEISTTQTMVLQGGVIFRGRVSIVGGVFNERFVVPKDISYENENGKIVFYFTNAESDGLGFTQNIIIGGTDTSVVNDGQGPHMEISFDSPDFKNGYLVNPNSTLIVSLSDDTGLNTTGTGIGHKMEGILNDDPLAPIDFTPYFTGDLDAAGKTGKINYKLKDLAQGTYSIKVKAWDVFNNGSSETTQFEVVQGSGLVVDYVMNYPNPFSNTTTFTFQQNLPDPINVKISVYTVAGRKINEIEERWITDKFVTIPWDGRDADGDLLANGTYFYQLSVSTVDGTFSTAVTGKLAVIR